MTEAAARDRARTPKSRHENTVGIDRYLHGILVNAGESNSDQDFGIGLDNIDRRFPNRVAD
jgi:hypothetical protein